MATNEIQNGCESSIEAVLTSNQKRRRVFGAKSEKLDEAQLELLLKEADLGKADASAEKAEAAPITGLLKPVPKRERKNERRQRLPAQLSRWPVRIVAGEIHAAPPRVRWD